jgi:hypothetical protein
MDKYGEALFRHLREHSQDIAGIMRELHHLDQEYVREHNKVLVRLDSIERDLREIKAKMAEPVTFTFSHLRQVPLIQAAFAIGATIGALRLPEESANFLISLAKLFLGG